MYPFFLDLIVIFGLALIAGFIWELIARENINRRINGEVGDEGMAKKTVGDSHEKEKVQIPVTGITTIKGWSGEAGRKVDYSFADIKMMRTDGRLSKSLPPLLMMAGVVGLTFFLGVTLLTRSATLVPGVILLAFSMYCAYLILTGFITKDN